VARFGDLLRSHRQAASLSQEELAIAAGLSTRAIGNMERGLTTRPYPRTLRLLVSALGLDDTAASKLISAAAPARRDEPVQGGRVRRRLSADLPGFTGRGDGAGGLREHPASQAGSALGTSVGPRVESVKMVRFLARAVQAGGVDARRLISDARIPEWVLRGEEAMVSPYFAMRMWELAEHAFEDPQLPLTVVAHYKPGELDLYDYLFTTAPTLRDGFDLSGRYLQLLTTNARLEVEAETDHEVTYSYRCLDADGRGAELALQFSAAVFCARASAGTRQPVAPIRVAFTQPAPRSHRTFSETFGTSRVDFGAPVTTFTFRSHDLNLPMPGADPALARILTRYAATSAPRYESLMHEYRRFASDPPADRVLLDI
jgi:transcriptional regulator with XRE-family HTH domain